MPEITDMTAMSVVVARMMPSSVRKLRSLLPRSDWMAPRNSFPERRVASHFKSAHSTP